jgi:sRNA-binding regulator protein Hfq
MNDSTPRMHGEERKPYVAKGHDRQLQRMQNTRERVTVVTANEDIQGYISRRDRYTVTIVTDDGTSRMCFKHAIITIDFVEE